MELKKVNYISDEELTSYKKELFNSIINDSSFYKEVLLSSFTNEDIMSNLSLFDSFIYFEQLTFFFNFLCRLTKKESDV